MFPPLIGFLIDWLIVSGSIDRQSESADRFFQKLTKFGQTFAQPALRLAVVVMMAATLGRSEWLSDLWSGGVVVIGLLILLGVAGRVACLLLIALLSWRYSGHAACAIDLALFCSAVWLMLLGTGRLSLWQGDEYWINRYDGA